MNVDLMDLKEQMVCGSRFIVNLVGEKYHEEEIALGRCRNPTLAKCGGEAQHFQSWGFGVLRDS
jgi:hypothetical protein